MEQKPTIGRIVHVATAAGTQLPAIITHVKSDTVVDVTVFNSDGTTSGRIELKKTPNPPMCTGDWNWPPRA